MDQLPAAVERFYYSGPVWPVVVVVFFIAIAGVGLAVATVVYFRRRDK